ncbi:MAG: DUF167 family protein, partial [Verrucomicrobiota bacterium]
IVGTSPGVDGPRLRLAVTEAAEDGRANRAVCAMLAGALGLAASAVTLLLPSSTYAIYRSNEASRSATSNQSLC